MERITDSAKEKVAIYATYTLLYINDMVCNEVLSLSSMVSDKDKETKKICGALMKRARNYLDFVNDVIGDKNLYYAEYCAAMDDFSDEKLSNFRESVINALKEKDVSDYEFVGRVEVIKILSFHAITSARYLINASKKVISQAEVLNQYVLTEVKRVSDNLSKWLALYYKIPSSLEISDKNIADRLTELNAVLLSYEPFEKSYKIAAETDYDELNKLMNG